MQEATRGYANKPTNSEFDMLKSVNSFRKLCFWHFQAFGLRLPPHPFWHHWTRPLQAVPFLTAMPILYSQFEKPMPMPMITLIYSHRFAPGSDRFRASYSFVNVLKIEENNRFGRAHSWKHSSSRSWVSALQPAKYRLVPNRGYQYQISMSTIMSYNFFTCSKMMSCSL